jgi:hypothetical protein
MTIRGKKQQEKPVGASVSSGTCQIRLVFEAGGFPGAAPGLRGPAQRQRARFPGSGSK